MFVSSGPKPALVGSILRRMPSRPAISSAENARYGFDVQSGGRNSMRLDRLKRGPLKKIGTRIAAERFPLENATLTGASKCGTRRLYELVVGAQNAISALMCVRRPPM